MNMRARRFTIETGGPNGAAADAEGLGAVLDAIADLKANIAAGPAGPAPEVVADLEKRSREVAALRRELDAIQQAIAETKGELASLQVGDRGRDISRLTDELAAVVSGTESATETVLQAAERIDQDATDLHAALKKTGNMDLVADIRDQVVAIFEACNFQDLTGQRITKVVSTLRFIEERVERMMDTWVGPESTGGGPVVLDTGEEAGTDGLLNGPKLDGDEGHASQTDIDALFK